MTWRVLEYLDGVFRGLWAGVWLGILTRTHFHRLDHHYYQSSKSYPGAEHNLSGLFGWETKAIDGYFRTCSRLVILGAGAGREVSPLLNRGFEVDAFECHEDLRNAGNDLLSRHKPGYSIQPMDRDLCPDLQRVYDGIIVGWGMYTLIQHRRQRIKLLRDLRNSVEIDAPLLLSFFLLGGPRRPFRIAAAVARLIRTILGRTPVEFGDYLSPRFAHYFTRESIEEELRAAGWRLEFFDTRTYPHAVALAEKLEQT